MKKILFAFVFSLILTACSKKNDPAPDAATSVAGTYQLTVVGQDVGDGAGYKEVTLPAATSAGGTLSGTLTASRVDENNITLSSVLKQTGAADSNQSIGQVTLQKNGSSYDMLANSSKIGTIDGTNIVIDVATAATSTTKAGRVVLKGKK